MRCNTPALPCYGDLSNRMQCELNVMLKWVFGQKTFTLRLKKKSIKEIPQDTAATAHA